MKLFRISASASSSATIFCMPAVMNTCLEGQYQGNLSVLYHHIFLRKRRAVGLPRATLVPYMMPVQGGRSHPLLHACKMLTISSWSATPLDSLVRCRTWTQYFPSRTPKFCTKTSGCFHLIVYVQMETGAVRHPGKQREWWQNQG